MAPNVDEDAYKLIVDGLVENKHPWTLDQLYALPQETQITQLICIEGGSAIGKWTGTPLREFLRRIGADMQAKYVHFVCAEGYSVSTDMPTALHPQTQMTLPSIGNAKTLPYLTLCAPFFDDAPNTPNKVGGNQDSPQIDCAKHIGDFHRCRSLSAPGARNLVLTPNIEAAVLFRPIRVVSAKPLECLGVSFVILVMAQPFRLKRGRLPRISYWSWHQSCCPVAFTSVIRRSSSATRMARQSLPSRAATSSPILLEAKATFSISGVLMG
jgi:Oxidoreductase molybdopterin binding domain